MGIRPISILLIALSVALLLSIPALAQDEDGPGASLGTTADEGDATASGSSRCTESDQVDISCTDCDISQITQIISVVTGTHFLLDKKVTGKYTILSPSCVSAEDAYQIFLSVLEINGFTTVKMGAVTKIVPRKNGGKVPVTTYTGTDIPEATDEFITQLYPLNYINSAEVSSALRNLVSGEGNLFAYAPSNTLVILDSAANVNRIVRIIQRLDVEGTEEQIEVIPLKYSSAPVVAEEILSLFGDQAGVAAPARGRTTRTSSTSSSRRARTQTASSSRLRGSAASESGVITKVIADLRTNSLVVKANRVGLRKIRDLVAKLDVPIPGGEGKIHVIYLKNADAEELAQVLAALAGNSPVAGGATRATSQRNQQAGGASAGGVFGAAGATAPRASGVTGGGAPTVANFEGEVRITSDPGTNSLVIVANPHDFQTLKDVIDKLDIPRRQVFVQALIIEITLEKGLDLGFEARSTSDFTDDGVQVIGGSNFGGINQAATNPLGITGLAIGAVDGTISFGGQTFANIGALFRAIQSDSDVNVLSTPTLLAMDNMEAEIVVADNVPFVTGQLYSAGGGGGFTPTTTIERKDVGITLKVTPQINESDYVKLEIYQEASNVTKSPEGLQASNVGVTTSKRSATTTVVVKDRQTVIIGGLMKEDSSIIESKVPILGDIPVLGYLFKYQNRSNKKTNLVIFL
ncbi:MAG: type II secretion system secretin GspD, partial [Candidatus Alcyoniella australis]|nr:type II secretion system secretin GspD [Candidatus Alcyoniella australis]